MSAHNTTRGLTTLTVNKLAAPANGVV